MFSTDGKNIFLFSPLQESNYELSVNVSSLDGNVASISTLAPTSTISYSKNVTSSGNLLLKIEAQVVLPPPPQNSGGWNPLFGFTGISFGGLTLDTSGLVAIFVAFSIALMVLGMKYSQKLLYFGLFLLSLAAIFEVGIFIVGGVLAAYLILFFCVKSFFAFRGRKSQSPPGGSRASSGSDVNL